MKLPRGFQKNISLAKKTTFKIGGKAKYFFIAKSKKDLIKAIRWAKRNHLPFFVLGGGSNLLVADEGFEGLVIKLQFSSQPKIHKRTLLRSSGVISLEVEAGTKLKKLVEFCLKNGITGLEWAMGIPGTLGGAIYGNASAFGNSISDFVKEVEVLDTTTLKIKIFKKKDCKFSLKETIFKKQKKYIILSAVLILKRGNKKEIKEKIRYYLEYRERNHPLNFPSAGCVFKNQKSKLKNQKLLKKFPTLKEFNKKGVIPAAFLIEKCNLKGKKIGDAQISPKHANFIVNLGKAKAKDVLELINLIKVQVRKKFGIKLKEEIQLLGFKNS